MANSSIAIIPRKTAISEGLPRYFTGKPCKHGHIAERKLSNGECIGCRMERNRERCRTDEFRAWLREYKNRNKDVLREADRVRYRKNADLYLERSKKYRIENAGSIKSKRMEYVEKNRELLREKNKEYRKRPDVKAKRAEWARNNRRSDVGANIRNRVQRMVHKCLRGAGEQKNKALESLLGYSTSELRTHLEKQFTNGMTWDIFLTGRIHIDHIKPVSSFNITSESCDDFRACWALSNLRPLWATDNLKKGAALTTLI